MTLQERATLLGFRSAWWICVRMPAGLERKIFRLIASLVFSRNGVSIKRLKFNVARVLGVSPDSHEAAEMARTSLLSYFDYWADLFRLTAFSKTEIHNRGRMEHREMLDAALAKGKGVVVVLPHSGNWDWAGAWIGVNYSSATTVAERLKPEELFEMFVKVRQGYGLEVLPHRGGAKPVTEILKDRLNAGKIVALVSDRDFTRRGIEVTLFGHHTTLPAGAIALSQETGAILIAAGVWTDVDNSVILQLYKTVDTKDSNAAALDIARTFEQHIAGHLNNWHMLQQIWPDHPVAWGGKSR